MGNYRGMMAGFGEALSTVGKLGLTDQIEQQKEARLEKVRLEAESRSDTRQLAAEGRQETRQIATEGRAGERADKERGQKTADDIAADARRQKNDLEKLSKAGEIDRKNKDHDQAFAAGKPNLMSTKFNDENGVEQTLIIDRSGIEKPRIFNADMNSLDTLSEGGTAGPRMPDDALAEAEAMARQQVSGMQGWLSGDGKDLSKYGGSEKAAIAALTSQNLPAALKAKGYNPADYGLGLVTQAGNPPASTPRTSSASAVTPPTGNTGAAPAARIMATNGNKDPEYARFHAAYQQALTNGRRDQAQKIIDRAMAAGVIRME